MSFTREIFVICVDIEKVTGISVRFHIKSRYVQNVILYNIKNGPILCINKSAEACRVNIRYKDFRVFCFENEKSVRELLRTLFKRKILYLTI